MPIYEYVCADCEHDFEAFLADPQTRHNQTVFEIGGDADASGGPRTRLLAHPARYAETPASLTRRAPTLGEHTAEILAESGLDEEEVRALAAAGVVRLG